MLQSSISAAWPDTCQICGKHLRLEPCLAYALVGEFQASFFRIMIRTGNYVLSDRGFPGYEELIGIDLFDAPVNRDPQPAS